MIVQTINQYQFTEAFRQIRPDNFSYEGQKALFEFFEEYSEDTGEPFELDVIAICCDFTEYESLAEFNEDYSTSHEDWDSVYDGTWVIPLDDGRAIVANF